jgi:hypothetical protein
LIPTPHLTVSVPELAEPLHNKLYQIRLGVQSIIDNTDSRIEAVRAEMVDALEEERMGREEEQKGRTEAERELGELSPVLAFSSRAKENLTSPGHPQRVQGR